MTGRFSRLSQSPVWQLQRAYFETQGPLAWSSGAVPHYVTSNPYLGRAYAEVIAGFAADRARDRNGADRNLYVVELGAGVGRLGYQVVRALGDALAGTGWRPVYVLTDLAERTVDWWQRHPWLAPLAASGALDFARYDLERDDRLVLRCSGRTIDRARQVDQLVVIANYVFDSIAQDLFAARGGVLTERLVATPALEADPAGAGFADASLAYGAFPASAAPYGDRACDAVLDGYRRAADGVFAFPRLALAAIERLRAFSRGPMLLLSADKGGARFEDVVTAQAPAFATHGSVSMQVNYHAIGAWTEARGGSWMRNPRRPGAIVVGGFALGARDLPSTHAAYRRAIIDHDPSDFFALKRATSRAAHDWSLAELLALLRFSCHDPKIVIDGADAFRTAAASADEADRAELVDALAAAWDNYLPIGEAEDVPAIFGDLAYELGCWADAISLYRASLALHGERVATLRRLVLAHLAANHPEGVEWIARLRAALPSGACTTSPPTGGCDSPATSGCGSPLVAS